MQEFFHEASGWFVSLDEFWRTAIGGAFGAGCFWLFVAVMRRVWVGRVVAEVRLSPLAEVVVRLLQTNEPVPVNQGEEYTVGPLRIFWRNWNLHIEYHIDGQPLRLRDSLPEREWDRVYTATNEALQRRKTRLMNLAAHQLEFAPQQINRPQGGGQ